MILERYRAATSRIDRETAGAVLRMLDALESLGIGELWTASEHLCETLDATGHGQADLVLCLLRLGSLEYVAELVGRPITVCPPQLSICRTPLPSTPRPRVGDDRRVVFSRSAAYLRLMSRLLADESVRPTALSRTSRKKIILSSPLYDRLEAVRVGSSVAQLLSRGVVRRDVAIATRRGWMRLEEPTPHVAR